MFLGFGGYGSSGWKDLGVELGEIGNIHSRTAS
jgi:hypothetical protein